MISVNEVIAIIDATVRKFPFTNSPFFTHAKRRGWVETISTEEIKSYVITDYKIYASPISSLTLKKRARLCQNTPPNTYVKNSRK